MGSANSRNTATNQDDGEKSRRLVVELMVVQHNFVSCGTLQLREGVLSAESGVQYLPHYSVKWKMAEHCLCMESMKDDLHCGPLV